MDVGGRLRLEAHVRLPWNCLAFSADMLGRFLPRVIRSWSDFPATFCGKAFVCLVLALHVLFDLCLECRTRFIEGGGAEFGQFAHFCLCPDLAASQRIADSTSFARGGPFAVACGMVPSSVIQLVIVPLVA